jgi:hypothetical protein
MNVILNQSLIRMFFCFFLILSMSRTNIVFERTCLYCEIFYFMTMNAIKNNIIIYITITIIKMIQIMGFMWNSFINRMTKHKIFDSSVSKHFLRNALNESLVPSIAYAVI